MTYSVKVNVSFDPESLCEHDMVESRFGLLDLLGVKVCRKCGATQEAAATAYGGIARVSSGRTFWRSDRDD